VISQFGAQKTKNEFAGKLKMGGESGERSVIRTRGFILLRTSPNRNFSQASAARLIQIKRARER
jgi:hypothetical protein